MSKYCSWHNERTIKNYLIFLMHNYNLWFISDENLRHHTLDTVLNYRFTTDLETFNKNLIDPIKLTFDSKIYNIPIKQTIQNEISRQQDKTNTNLIWYFHQNIFKYIWNGWEVPKRWFDIVNYSRKVFVEMKNKHNTMNSSSSQKTYINMQSKILEDNRNCCLLVEVIAKNSQNIPWKNTINWIQQYNENIRRVSIDRFYELVTGESDAFMRLCSVLPIVLDDVVSTINERQRINSVIEELKIYSEDILKSLYLFSFDDYLGFDNFSFQQ